MTEQPLRPARSGGKDGNAAVGRRLFAALPALAFFALAALLLVRLFAGDASRVPSALIGKHVPSFSLPALEGSGAPGLADSDLKGGVTLVNVFASWCVPCHQEHPALMELARRGVPIVGIAYKDEPENARRFLGGAGNPYTRIGVDRSGRTTIDFGVYGVPETFVVRPDGRIAHKFVGPLTADAIKGELMPAIEAAR